MRRIKRKNTLEIYEKAQVVEKELVDKISLWMLRIIIKLRASKEFIDKDNYFSKDSIAHFLDIGNYVDLDRDTFKSSKPVGILKQYYIKLENKKRFTSSKILSKNIRQISKLMQLNSYEEQILEFIVLINQYEILDDTADLLGVLWGFYLRVK